MVQKAQFVWRHVFLGAVCLASLSVVSACSATSFQPFNPDQVNLAETSYGAAEILLHQSKNVITPQTPLEIGVLTNIKRPSETNALGQLIASQIGARFVQLGYNVTTSPALDPVAISSQPAAYTAQTGNKAMITGHYAIARMDVLVNLRIIEESSGRLLAAYDYSLPLNRDVKELMAAEGENKNSILGF